MDSYKFWTVCSGILYHSRRTCSDCCRNAGGGNMFLTLVSKTDQNGSVVFKSGDCAYQVRCWSSPSCSSNHDWTVPAVWMGELMSWKTVLLFGSNVWIMGCTWLPNFYTYSLAVIRPWRVIVGPMEYHNIATQIITEPLQCFTVRTRHSRL
jgi:hypothetical protein